MTDKSFVQSKNNDSYVEHHATNVGEDVQQRTGQLHHSVNMNKEEFVNCGLGNQMFQGFISTHFLFLNMTLNSRLDADKTTPTIASKENEMNRDRSI